MTIHSVRTATVRATHATMAGAGRAVRAAAVLALTASTAAAQRPQFAPTLFWDAGLINTPAAYVAPLGGDLSINYARMPIPVKPT